MPFAPLKASGRIARRIVRVMRMIAKPHEPKRPSQNFRIASEASTRGPRKSCIHCGAFPVRKHALVVVLKSRLVLDVVDAAVAQGIAP